MPKVNVAPQFEHEDTAVLRYRDHEIEIPYSVLYNWWQSTTIDSGTTHFASMALLHKEVHRMFNEMGRQHDLREGFI